MTAGKYKALRALNTSGTATLAENTADGRKYALKELTEESAPIYRRISQLPPQENLMRVCEILPHGERSVAVCEYVDGQTLDELLSSGKTFPITALRRIIFQLCNAVEHLHRYGIIHRDVTPKNIILEDNLHLTLIDFDISRKFSGNREQDTTLYGTEGFAPPEQYGFRETGFTADIYALGVIMKRLPELPSGAGSHVTENRREMYAVRPGKALQERRSSSPCRQPLAARCSGGNFSGFAGGSGGGSGGAFIAELRGKYAAGNTASFYQQYQRNHNNYDRSDHFCNGLKVCRNNCANHVHNDLKTCRNNSPDYRNDRTDDCSR